MKKKFFFALLKTLSVLLIFSMVILLTVSTGQTADVPGVSGDTIKIGMIFDKTGPTVTIQGPLADGAKTYFRYVNDQGGINGRKLKWIHEDDRYTIPTPKKSFPHTDGTRQ